MRVIFYSRIKGYSNKNKSHGNVKLLAGNNRQVRFEKCIKYTTLGNRRVTEGAEIRHVFSIVGG